MRIAVNTRFLIPNKLEGLGWQNYELCRALVQAHPEHEFLFLFDRPYAREFLFGENVRGLVIPPPARRTWLWHCWFEWSLPLAFRILRPDVFLSPDGYCSLRARVPTVMISHDLAHVHYPDQLPGAVRRYYDRQVPRFLERADRVLTVSDFVKKDILQHYAVDPAKIRVAHNALRGHFAPVEAAEQVRVRDQYSGGKAYFFYLGAIHPRKNLWRLIRAFDRFKSATGADTKLLIGGRMAWKTERIRAAFDTALHRDDIHFLGYLPEEELPRVIGSALALTYVSLFEGFGLPLLEAMHAEIPILTSTVSSLPEVAGPAALLVDPQSEEAIARGMQRLQGDPELRAELVAKGRQQKRGFSWERSAGIVYQALEEVAGR